MIVAKDKKEGQRILAKLRADGHVWVTARYPGPEKKRMRFVPVDEELSYNTNDTVLCVINQKLHIMSYYEGKLTDIIRGPVFLPVKKIFGVLKEAHDRI